MRTSCCQFLGAVAKLQTATISFVMSARPRVTRLPQEGFSQNLIFEYLSKSFEEIQVSLKSDENNSTVQEEICTCMVLLKNS